MRFTRKLFKRLIWTIVILLIIVNVFIVVTGRFYLYKGIAYTYLSGESGPTIYDLEKFPSSRIKKSVSPTDWEISSTLNNVKLTESQEKYFESLETKAILVFKIMKFYMNVIGMNTLLQHYQIHFQLQKQLFHF